jgi:hypothetical protein
LRIFCLLIFETQTNVNMKKLISLFILIALNQVLFSQISTILPYSVSIANTSVADTRNWNAFSNPAMLGYLENPEIGMQYENRYLISELSSKTIQASFSNKLLNSGLSFSHFGYSLYHEMVVGLGFARNFSDKFAMGLQFNYYTAYFNASNSYHGAFLPQLGLSVKLNSCFSVGFQSFNPFQTNIRTELGAKRLPSIFSLGTEYFFSNDLIWRSQIDKELSSNYRFATGFEYQMLQLVNIKLGAYASDYLVPCIGLGFGLGQLRFDLNCELHPLLGLNTLAFVKYRFRK